MSAYDLAEHEVDRLGRLTAELEVLQLRAKLLAMEARSAEARLAEAVRELCASRGISGHVDVHLDKKQLLERAS